MPWKKPAAIGFLLLIVLFIVLTSLFGFAWYKGDPKIMMLLGIVLGGLLD